MKKLKIVLPLKVILIILATVIYCTIFLNINHSSKYDISDTEFIGIVDKINISEEKTTIALKAKEKLLVNCYDVLNIKIGDKIKVIGNLEEPNSNSNFNLFNYKK